MPWYADDGTVNSIPELRHCKYWMTFLLYHTFLTPLLHLYLCSVLYYTVRSMKAYRVYVQWELSSQPEQTVWLYPVCPPTFHSNIATVCVLFTTLHFLLQQPYPWFMSVLWTPLPPILYTPDCVLFVFILIILAVLPKPKNIIASRFRTGSAEDEDLLGPEMSDFRWVLNSRHIDVVKFLLMALLDLFRLFLEFVFLYRTSMHRYFLRNRRFPSLIFSSLLFSSLPLFWSCWFTHLFSYDHLVPMGERLW